MRRCRRNTEHSVEVTTSEMVVKFKILYKRLRNINLYYSGDWDINTIGEVRSLITEEELEYVDDG